MKTVFLFPFFLLWSHCVRGHKKIKLWRADVRQELANYDQIVTFHDKKKRFATVKIIDKAGILRNEANFKDELKARLRAIFIILMETFIGNQTTVTMCRTGFLWCIIPMARSNGRRNTEMATEKKAIVMILSAITYYLFSFQNAT
jgi:hypothetical protein